MFSNKSLGVGTFNIKQQQAILEEVELQLRLHPEIEDFFKSTREEHFFVKNLETIQGDERDVIFLSIGFGFDESRRLTLNFGPLNHEGGERRLNVLISRARERCVVFSNFRASDLSLDGTAPFGLRALKVFLDYAENRNLHSVEATGEDTDSPFEDSVYDFLRSHSYEVRKQVGCAGFRVDLAVVDPKSPGRYLLGVECDGAKYHRSPVARDRDRLRQQILEDLGWRLYRVWSTDWYRNRRESEERLLDAIERAKHEEHASIGVLRDPPPHRGIPEPYNDTENEENSDPSAIDGTLDNMVPNYEVCSSLGIATYGELHEQPTDQLAKAVIQVVEVEGPIHFDEVVRRIRSLWGLKRAGQRIYDAISRATSAAERKGQVRRRGDFLWPATDRVIPVRRRCGDPPAKIELICDEEIAEVVKLVLKYQFATLPNDLIVRSSRLLGIQATRGVTADRIKAVIEKLIDEGELQQMPNGMIHFARS
jgi:very-short-patch-repair endonuclease